MRRLWEQYQVSYGKTEAILAELSIAIYLRAGHGK
jgi:hypothetical protein